MAEEVKETMEQFETQLEESLNKAATNEDAVWNHLEELKESGGMLAPNWKCLPELPSNISISFEDPELMGRARATFPVKP